MEHLLADDVDDFVEVVKVVPLLEAVTEGVLELAEPFDVVLLTEETMLEVFDVEDCAEEDCDEEARVEEACVGEA